jgi:hypothetical protein
MKMIETQGLKNFKNWSHDQIEGFIKKAKKNMNQRLKVPFKNKKPTTLILSWITFIMSIVCEGKLNECLYDLLWGLDLRKTLSKLLDGHVSRSCT